MAGFESREIAKLTSDGISRSIDHVTSERPLSIIVVSVKHGEHELGITMRTEGHDDILSMGFLYSEGIISSADDIEQLLISENQVIVKLKVEALFDPTQHCRRSTVTSSCGLCGRIDLENVLNEFDTQLDESMKIHFDAVKNCINSVIGLQEIFSITGGSHACASFTSEGEIDRVFEDVGRHNAFDKLVGSYLNEGFGERPLGAFVSGRASFELVQKSIRAGYPIMISVGAPSTMAVDLAKEHGMTLGCFAKDESIKFFSGVRRII